MQNEGEDFLTVHIYPVNGTKQFGLYEENKPGAMLSYTQGKDGLTFKTTPTDRQLRLLIHDENGIKTIDVPDATAGVEVVTSS
jgi:hypothetical protein